MATPDPAEFDTFAADYDRALGPGIRLVGVPKEVFAESRIRLVATLLRGRPVRSILDFGCGTGLSIPFLRATWPSARLLGYDVSAVSLTEAARRHDLPGVEYSAQLPVATAFDLIFTHGVLHHIPIVLREGILRDLGRRLRPGGRLVVSENNPWNPLMVWAMARAPMDADARPLTPHATVRLLRRTGWSPIRCIFTNHIPPSLPLASRIECLAAASRFGSQYLVLTRKSHA